MKISLMEWDEKYNLCIEDIDLQHRFFFNLIKRIYKDLSSSDDKLYKDSLIFELSAYARFHFLSEENIMLKAEYPDLGKHKLHHLQLLDKLSTQGQLYMQEEQLVKDNEMFDFLVDWFLHHTTGVDKDFAKFFHKKMEI
ncbi:bacteriohemerythrin [Desulfogranum japonicum]|uniref:bacteriohemerythrin n=1 Tax=Desulfogranum japonicum TaxID=231447 RepID=UPI00041D4951|nr:hemerythrin family protein [Desulfogranum japonicum]